MGFFKGSGLGKECDKAAQVLKSFLKKDKIPKEAIANAKGIAIFTAVRAGMYLAGSGGSGVVVARLPDGSWSPPSAFSVRSGSFGIVYGVDVYDCVCILNTQDAVDAYTKTEMSLGGGASVAAGPMNASTTTSEVKPVWVYTKSRGLYGGLTVDGTVIKEKPEMNAEFYGSKVTSEQILKGEVEVQDTASKWPGGAAPLMEILKAAEGKSADTAILHQISDEATPGDLQE